MIIITYLIILTKLHCYLKYCIAQNLAAEQAKVIIKHIFQGSPFLCVSTEMRRIDSF